MRALAIIAMVPAAATLYFFAFWTWFPFWRRHRVLTYGFMFCTIGGVAALIIAFRDCLLGPAVEPPLPAVVVGWVLIAAAAIVGMIADRQLGMRIRSFMPFFEPAARIELRTRGAYAIVRHPIYASGLWLQAGVFLVTGYIAIALVVLTLGALWFTRQEERRLLELLDDPDAYARYRARVPALFPRPW